VQINPNHKELEDRIVLHQMLLGLALRQECNLILFPELSITGYKPEQAKFLAFAGPNDARVDVFADWCKKYGVHVVVGAPMISADGRGVHISAFIFHPDGSRLSYKKRFLHEDEVPFFLPGDTQAYLTMENGDKAGLAICYESLLPEHPAEVRSNGANVYLTSVAKHEDGIKRAIEYFPEIAKLHNMPIVMANLVGPCEDFVNAGRSSVWSSRGDLLASMDSINEGVIVFDLDASKAEVVTLPRIHIS